MTLPKDQSWELKTLGECALWMSGGTPRKSRAEYWGGSIPWISAKSMGSFHIWDSDDRVTELGAQNGTRLVERGTILFIVRGMSLKSEFRMGIAQRALTFNQDLKALVAVESVDPRFLAYAILAQTPVILNIVDEAGHGTGRLPTDLLKALPIELPPLPEQRRIAAVLGALDDKIELNRKMNRTLEEMAQAIFKSWFIDFDGVPASEMVESELGLIPKGWEALSLGQAIKFHDKYRVPLSKRQRSERQGEYPYHGATSVMDHVDDYIFDSTYILLGEDGSVVDERGHPILQYAWGKFWVNNHAHVLSPRDPIGIEHLLMALKNLDVHPFVTGAVQAKISQRNLIKAPFILPPSDCCTRFTKTIEPLYARLRLSAAESQTLAELRDTLLPKLISGEIRVPETEEAVEATS